MRRSVVPGLTALLITSMAATATAADLPPCPDVIEYGLVPDGLDKGGINAGVVKALEARSGCRFRVIPMPAERVLTELASGKLQMSATFFQTPERDRYAWFAHFMATKNLAVSLASAPRPGTGEEIVANPRLLIGVVRGFRHGVAIDALLSRIRDRDPQRIVEFRDRDTLLTALTGGRVQLIFLSRPILGHYQQKYGATTFTTSDVAPDEPRQPGGVMLARQRFDEAETRKWQRLIRELCEDGTFLKVFRGYFEAGPDDLACRPKVAPR